MNRLVVFPCHADADRAVVEGLYSFLQLNLDLDWCAEEARLRPDEHLLARIRHALQGDVVLVLLSPNSSTAPWPRAQWEAIFHHEAPGLGVRIGRVLLRDCPFPSLLRNQDFFDLTQGSLDGFRRIKRWLLGLGPPAEPLFFAPPPPDSLLDWSAEVEQLGRLLADRPGVIPAAPGLAAAFAHHCREDFHGVFWIPCGRRSPARVAGELAAQIGLRLEGDTSANQEALRAFCAARRCLLVFEDAPADAPLNPGGKASVLITTGPSDPREQHSFDTALDALATSGDWTLACRLAREAVRLARAQGRLAEAGELLEAWFAAAERRGDRRVLDESAWERTWILEHWGRFEEAGLLTAFRRAFGADQMSFDFISGPVPPFAPPAASPGE